MPPVLPPRNRWQQIDSVFQAALDCAPAELEAYLATACAGDIELEREVRALLAATPRAASLIGESATDYVEPLLAAGTDASTDALRESDLTGTQLGSYRLLEEIGRGGMGTVYRAQRSDAQFEKQVAVKLVKRGMDTDEVLRRFRWERQILATLEHPNIARLLDGGAAPDGRPYLVMEYIEGRSVTAYCDEHRLGIEERLALFQTVCRAVQYAHQNLVVHRDIKPSNILVTSAGEVKLLDFGIAKLLDEHAGGDAPHTRTEVRMLTPDYAAPEQVLGKPVTTASDAYALGVVLYELLAGHRPYSLAGKDPLEQARLALEHDVERPSHAVTHAASALEIASRRGTTPERLARRLRGDLDTICLKALAKDPERRYRSAEQLAEDLRRHLSQLPLLARRDTVAYRAARFARRHRGGVVAASLVLLSLVGGLGAALWQGRQAALERDRARLEAEKASVTLGFMTDLFEGADPDESRGDTLTVFQLLERGSARLPEQPALRATVQNVLGSLYLKLGDFDRAQPLLQEALATRYELLGEGHDEVTQSRKNLALLLTRKGEYDRADSIYRLAVAAERKRAAPDSTLAALLIGQGFSLAYTGRYREAEPLLREAVRVLESLPGDHRKLLANGRYGIAFLLYREGRYPEAEALLRDVLALRRSVYGELHNEVIDALEGLGNVLHNTRQYAAAEPFLQEALDKRRHLLGPDHPTVSATLNNLALIPTALGQYERADSMLRASLAIVEKHLGREHRDYGMTLSNIAWAAMEKGDLDAAEAQFREALGIMRRASGEESGDAALLMGNLATALQRGGKYAEAERLYRGALDVRAKVHGRESMPVSWRQSALADLLREVRRYEEAERLQRESLALRRKLQGEEGADVAQGLAGLARVVCEQGRYAEADTLYRRAVEMHREQQGEDHEDTGLASTLLGDCLVAQRRYAEAEPLLLAGHTTLSRASGGRSPKARKARESLATLYSSWGKPEKAAEYRELGRQVLLRRSTASGH